MMLRGWCAFLVVWAFFIAQGELCGFTEITNGRISRWAYYNFPKLYFPTQKGKQINYYCYDGFKTESEGGQITCTEDGWTPAPKCLRKCDQVSLNDMNILYEDSTYTEGTTASYECHSEFGTPEGNKGGIIECLPDGQFSKAECIESTCSLANTSRYHHFISDRTFKNGHAVKFDCEEGYKLIGSPKIQCYYFGWYPEPPHCNDAMNPTSPGGVRPPLLQLKASAETEEQCPPPPTLANIEEGSMKAAYYNGDTIMYDCEENYKRYGSAHITCVKGTWTSPPQCIKEIKCGPAPFIAHGDIVSIQQKFFNSGTFVDYKCQDLHIMRGPSRVRCRKGSWSALPECLEPCTARPEEMAANNIRLKWSPESKLYSQHGQFIEFECISAEYRKNETLPFRAQCTRGQLEHPNCVRM
ncbi:coagulation factor XIII B chain-like isoform X2 [Ambystoma mexicanum]|uniref:coagulation factor XIII B chain-like isoform X2 n=1 Tax=Ambystoma mexicanum TaxID=8296 RepID=UPI0037E88DE7